jgi:hypothetical protein
MKTYLQLIVEYTVLPDEVEVSRKVGFAFVTPIPDVPGHCRKVHRFCDDCKSVS